MSTDKKSSQPNPSTGSTMLILGTFLDTTWRMFIPVILFAGIGYAIDAKCESLPIATLLGIGFGAIASFVLVRLQYKKLKGTHEE